MRERGERPGSEGMVLIAAAGMEEGGNVICPRTVRRSGQRFLTHFLFLLLLG